MADRVDSDQPRKRIAVACGRCRKRKIRCSGDPGNGGPCSNCKNAGYEPCLFLRVSSQETPLKDAADFSYNLDAARTYAHHSRGPVSPLSPIPQYAHELGAGDGLTTYRQSAYPYSTNTSKGYYPNMSGWASAYQDDGSVDYNLNYSPYPIINQETPLLSGYSPYATRKSVYVDPEASSYSYSNLTHRPATSGDSQGFSLSSMAASLPSPADRLHSNVNRTLTSSTTGNFRNDGAPGAAAAAAASAYATTGKTSSPADVAYGNLQQHAGFEPAAAAAAAAYSTSSNTTLAIAAHRATAHADATYPTGAATAGVATTDQLYAAVDQGIRPTEDAGYVYSDSKLGGGGGGGGVGGGGGGGSGSGSRRDSQHSSSGGGAGAGGAGAGSLLSNGHVYVPESHSAHPSAHHNAYVVPGPASSASVTIATSSSSSSLLSTHSNSSSSSSLSSSSHSHSQGRGGGGGGGGGGLDGATTPVVDANGSTGGLVRGGNCGAAGMNSGNSSNSSSVSGSSQQHHHQHHQRLSDGHRRSAGSLRGG